MFMLRYLPTDGNTEDAKGFLKRFEDHEGHPDPIILIVDFEATYSSPDIHQTVLQYDFTPNFGFDFQSLTTVSLAMKT